MKYFSFPFLTGIFLPFPQKQRPVFLQSLLKDLAGLIHRSVKFAAGSIQMTAAAKEFGSQPVTGKSADRT